MIGQFTKTNVRKKELTILISVVFFLAFAYFGGNLKWMSNFQLFVDLLSAIFAFFIGTLSLLRFYTRKTHMNFLFLGLGFLAVGIIETLQIFTSMGAFTDLFAVNSSEAFPTTVVISRLFLAFLMFVSWLFTNQDKEEKNEKLAYIGIVVITTLVAVFLSIFSNIFSSYEGYQFAIIGQTVSMMLYLMSLLGYIRNGGIKVRNFDFWLIFSLVFAVISQIFFLPYLNLEYDYALNFATISKFLSYLLLLVGFLNSIYDMYKLEQKHQVELEKKNRILSETKKKVEEAYMLLRTEKWKLTKESEKNTADKIMKDILKD